MRSFPSSPLLSLIFLLGAFLPTISAWGNSIGTVTVNTLSATPLRAEAGGLLSGNAVRVGTFDLSGAGLFIVGNSNSFSRLDALFTPLGENIPDAGTVTQANNLTQALIVNDALGQQGEILGQISGTSTTYIAPNSPLYLWVFNHPNPSLATEWGIYGSTSISWTLPDQLGSTNLSTDDADIILRGSLSEGILLLASNSSSYESWLTDSFTDSELASPLVTSQSSDPDDDGSTNIAEYYFGTSPKVADTPGSAFQVGRSPGQLDLIWTRSVDVSDVIAIPQSSPDLVTWEDQVPLDISSISQSFSLPLTLGKAFTRLRFQLQ